MKSEISLQSVKSLVRLDFRSRFDSAHKSKKEQVLDIATNGFTLLVYALMIAGIYFLTEMFVVKSGMRIEFLVIATMTCMIIATAIATSSIIKNLYTGGDNELLLRFPVSAKEILLSKSIYAGIHNLVVTMFLILPFYVMFGVLTYAGAGYYFAAIGVALLTSLIPFFIANIIAIPVMMVMNSVKNLFLLVLVGTVLLICAGFALYMEALSAVLQFLANENESLFSPTMIEQYQNFATHAYPFNWFAYLLNGKVYGGLTGGYLALSFLGIMLLNSVLGTVAYFVTTRGYYKIILNGIENEKTTFTKAIKIRKRPVFIALIRREFYLILRSFNYSFQYLAMALAAPVMVYYCNNLATSSATSSLGSSIVPGLTLMITIIFVAIIVSFASTTISREGGSFYHTKTMPVSFTAQIASKLFLYAIVGTGSVLLCCLVTGLGYATGDKATMSAGDVVAIFFISEMLVLSLSALAIWADVKSPTFNVAGDGELVAANKNVALSLFVGIATALLFGAFAMIFSFIPISIGSDILFENNIEIFGTLAGVSALLMIVSFVMLFAGLNKRYMRIAS